MKEDKDYNKRLEGHTEPLEIEQHYQEKAPAAAAPAAAESAAPRAGGHAGGGGIGWAALGGIAAAFIVCAVYVGSGFKKSDQTTAFVETTTITVPAGQTGQTSPTSQTGQVAQTAQSSPAATDHQSADAVYLFPLDGSKITDNAELNRVAEQAKKSGAEVEIMAYTDPSGSTEYNQKLSERRAQAVADYLAAHGVDPAHIHAHGCGPTTDFTTAAQDRRAEVHLM